MKTTMVHVRLDQNLKEQAAEMLSSMGLSISDAVRVFLTRVVTEKAIPFPVRAPNAESLDAIAEAKSIIQNHRARFKTAEALFDDLEKTSQK